MKDIWNVLEERTRTWEALERQSLADAIWEDYISVRFGRTGNPRALEYLYPYLNHAHRQTRSRAIEVAAHVFAGRGQRAIDDLDYFTRNPDLFLRDRAVQVIGVAVNGSGLRIILQVLAPYLSHRNQFVRRLAVIALGEACAGRGNGTSAHAKRYLNLGYMRRRNDGIPISFSATGSRRCATLLRDVVWKR